MATNLKKAVGFLFLVIFLCRSIYASCEDEKECIDNLSGSRYAGGGVRFYSDSHSFNNVTGQYTLNARMKNWYNQSSEVEYEWYVCRCDEAEGNAFSGTFHVCVEYFPDILYTGGGDHEENCLGLGKVNISLGPYEEKNVSVSIEQPGKEACGLFQTDMHLYRINNNAMDHLVAWGLFGLCEDCDNNCTRGGIFEFCEEFYCGPACFTADWQNNELEEEFPHDCTMVVISKEGSFYPKCVPTTCAD